MISAFGNFPGVSMGNCPKKLVELSFDGTIALGAVVALGSSGKNFTKTLSGVTATGYTYPSCLNSIFAKNAGESVEIYAQILTDTVEDTSTYLDTADITIQDVTLTGTNKTKELYIVTKSRGTPVGKEDKPQSPLMIIRKASGTQIPEDIDEIFLSYYTRIPSNVATIMEYPTANTAFHTIGLDIKTGNYGGDEGIGDYRTAIAIVEDGIGLRYRLQADNVANGKDIVPGLTAYNNGTGGYWQEYGAYGDVALGETIKIDFYIKRPASYADVTTGETTCRITKISDGTYVQLRHVGGVQKGIGNLPLSRFMWILYNLGTPPATPPLLDMPITGIEIWDIKPRQI